jgi:hypothetical protein
VLYAEPLRRRMRVRFGGEWIADSEDVVLLHEPGHYPVAYFPIADIRDGAIERTERVTRHRELGAAAWFPGQAGEQGAERSARRTVLLSQPVTQSSTAVASTSTMMSGSPNAETPSSVIGLTGSTPSFAAARATPSPSNGYLSAVQSTT